MTLPVSCKAAITEDILPFLSKPSRYIAAEWNSVVKDPAAAEVRVALAFPDVYEIGMSHLGLEDPLPASECAPGDHGGAGLRALAGRGSAAARAPYPFVQPGVRASPVQLRHRGIHAAIRIVLCHDPGHARARRDPRARLRPEGWGSAGGGRGAGGVCARTAGRLRRRVPDRRRRRGHAGIVRGGPPTGSEQGGRREALLRGGQGYRGDVRSCPARTRRGRAEADRAATRTGSITADSRSRTWRSCTTAPASR